MKTLKITILLITLSLFAQSQEDSIKAFNPVYLNWYNLDLFDDKVLGASVNKAYQELLANKKVKKTIIVAVIDGGVDIYNMDLQGKIWINEREIPNNKIDDDDNGYVDDINGWNFIGNSKGENIDYETFEYTRIYELSGNDENFQKAKQLYEAELAKRMKERNELKKIEEKYNIAKLTIKVQTGIEINQYSDLKKVAFQTSNNYEVSDAYNFLIQMYKKGFSDKSLLAQKTRNYEFLEKYLNVDFNPRAIIGDNPNEINSYIYGNFDVKGPKANHGTSVAGVIAGIRGNSVGVDGIATNVKIMVLRTTPSGDERDKDVALAIKYAVENGADIINMSFGKQLSPQKHFVDDAIKLAERKNVLIIHACGNNGLNIDTNETFPSDYYLDKSEATNFLNVASSGIKKGKEIASKFSNYGQNHVDVFAPGENIISLDTSNTFSIHSGTSLSAPVVTGIAALILSYYPQLTPQELINILMESSLKFNKQRVLIPDLINKKRGKVKFSTLSKSGGIVNAYKAIQIAETYK